MPEALWQALERAPLQGQILAEWRLDLGEDLPQLLPYLRPTEHLGETLRCPSPGGEGCPRQILEDGQGRFTAYCGDVPIYCDPVHLERGEIIVYELNHRKLAEALAGALGFEASPDPTQDPFTHCLGVWSPGPTDRWRVFFTLAVGASFRRSASELLVDSAGPFVLLSPSVREHETQALEWLKKQESHSLALSQIVRFEAQVLTADHTLADLLRKDAGGEPEYAFRKEGQLWQITFRGETHTFTDLKGFNHIARVLAAPGQECHVRDLVQAEAGEPLITTSAGEMADSQAVHAYRKRMQELHDELEGAEIAPSEKRQDEIWDEIEALEAELRRIRGLGGRPRREKDDLERMRNAVRNAMHRSIVSLKDAPALARHFEAAFSFGMTVRYLPESPIEWVL